MNILQNTVRETARRDFFYDGVEPKIDFRNRDLCSYIFCKSYNALNRCNPKVTIQMADILCIERELRFSKNIAEACEKKLAECFSEKNPLSEIIASKIMKNFASAFNLTELDMKILLLTIFFERNNWHLERIIDADEKVVMFCCFVDLEKDDQKYQDECNYIQTQYNLLNSGVFTEKWKLSKGAYFYFGGGIPCNLRRLDRNGNCFFSMQSIEKANKLDIGVVEELLSKCHDKTDGFFMTMFDQEQDKIENVISYVAKKNNFVAFVFETREKIYKEILFFYITAFSAQLADINGIIVLPKDIADMILEDDEERSASFDPIDFLERYVSEEDSCTDYNQQFKTNDTNDSHCTVGFNARNYLNFIQCPVVLLTKPFEEIVSEYDKDVCKDRELIQEMSINFYEKAAGISMFNWQLKMPAQNDYADNLYGLLKKFHLNESAIEFAVDECCRLGIEAKYWNRVAKFLVAANLMKLSKKNISLALQSMIETSEGMMELRRLENYDLSVLKTSMPVDDLIKCIQNAEKFQAQKFNVDSGIRILLYGISGTGKTAFVEHVAKIIGRQVLPVRMSDIERRGAGDAERNIVTMFKSAANTGALLLIDEADSLLADRRHLELSWQRGLVNEFIQQMERFPGILFCATNLAEYLDSATNRRFHIQVKFEPLDKAGVEKLCSIYFSEVSFTDLQIRKICNAGDVCPGDFGAVSGMLRFSDPSKLNADYITDELVKTVKAKEKVVKPRSIGF